eukprot:NODE_26855_length_214_cov_2.230303_g25685_i0.p4 GENE.NODE_26855_length_214_cov_2.230303_g25685_i0~~NODE_26855_length_214_cov_2.230303_g25685_i0.p4  ORF type:complete len:59 (+),score=14.43 NODE_26855_length_214_cov_2.230303_g25685_i0:2-178(+)
MMSQSMMSGSQLFSSDSSPIIGSPTSTVPESPGKSRPKPSPVSFQASEPALPAPQVAS